MGFSKRYITKEKILDQAGDLHRIVRLQNADCLIIDEWGDSFYKNFDFNYIEYQKRRDSMMGLSITQIKEHNDFDVLKRLSNIYINLNNGGNLTDAILACSVMGLEFLSFKNLDDLRIEFNKMIDSYFTNP